MEIKYINTMKNLLRKDIQPDWGGCNKICMNCFERFAHPVNYCSACGSKDLEPLNMIKNHKISNLMWVTHATTTETKRKRMQILAGDIIRRKNLSTTWEMYESLAGQIEQVIEEIKCEVHFD